MEETKEVIDSPVAQDTQTSNIQVEEKQPEESFQDRNWKRFREEKEMERKRREEAEKVSAQKQAEAEALKAAMEAILNKQPAKQEIRPETNYYDNGNNEESDDEKIEKKVQAALLARERQYESQRQQQEAADLPIKLAQTYSDFNNVCSTENLDYLEFHYPEIATAFKHSPNNFEKWTAVYKAVKRFVPNPDGAKDKKKAESNLAKPQSMSVGGATQTGDSPPVMLDDKRRADNWSRMQKVMKGGR